MIATEKRNFGLDVIRFVAIVFVLIAHSFAAVSAHSWVSVISSFTAVIGVELFFVLSGFLIGTILIKTHNQEVVTSLPSVKNFWTRRWFRTLPNYYLMILVYMAVCLLQVQRLPIGSLKILSYLVFLQDGASQEMNRFFNVSWSLCVEEWFYLLFPLFLLIVQTGIRQKRESFLTVILIFLIVPMAGRMIMTFSDKFLWDAGFRKMTFTRLDSIGIGVLAAFVKYYYHDFWQRYRKLLFAIGALSLTLLLIYFYYKLVANYDLQSSKEGGDAGFFMKVFFFNLFGLGVAMLLPIVYQVKAKASSVPVRVVTFISIISYSLYLLHPVMIVVVQTLFEYHSAPFKLIMIWIFSIGTSYIVYAVYESRMTRLRERFKDNAGVVATVEGVAIDQPV